MESLAAKSLLETADNYTEDNTLFCGGAVKVNLEIANAGIFVQFAIRNPHHPGINPSSNFGQEVFKGPNTYLLARNVDAVRIRSAVSGKPAVVTIEALGPGE